MNRVMTALPRNQASISAADRRTLLICTSDRPCCGVVLPSGLTCGSSLEMGPSDAGSRCLHYWQDHEEVIMVKPEQSVNVPALLLPKALSGRRGQRPTPEGGRGGGGVDGNASVGAFLTASPKSSGNTPREGSA